MCCFDTIGFSSPHHGFLLLAVPVVAGLRDDAWLVVVLVVFYDDNDDSCQ